MSRVQFTARAFAAGLAVAALLVLLVLVWGLRPALPNLDRSPTGPPARTVAEQIVDVIAWAAAITVILRLIVHTAHAILDIGLPRSGGAAGRLRRALARQPALEKRRWPLVHLSTPQAYPLIVRSPGMAPPQLNVREPAAPTNAAAAVADPPPRPATGKSISILGPLKIEGARQRGRKLRSLTAQVLLYLVLHAEGATVEQLADALLPETDHDASRNRLWQSASEARRVLGDSFHRDEDGRYSVDRATVRIDLDELDLTLAGNHDRPIDPPDATRLEHAFALFRGDPLQGVDWPWAEGHRRRLRATYVDLIEQVGRANLERADSRGALELAERGLAVDRLNETLWRLAMQADAAAGLRDSVSRRYTELREVLQRDLGLEPATETRALYLNLLGQD